MTLRVVYRDEAIADIAEAMRWYRARQDGLDERFLDAVLACEALVRQFPKGAPVVHRHMRQTPLKGFPYVLVFGTWHGELVVYRVFHTSQHPRTKLKRRKK